MHILNNSRLTYKITGRDHQGVLISRGWTPSSEIWEPTTSHWTKQSTWLRTVLGEGWCLHTALRTPSGACQKRRRCNGEYTDVLKCLSCKIQRKSSYPKTEDTTVLIFFPNSNQLKPHVWQKQFFASRNPTLGWHGQSKRRTDWVGFNVPLNTL